MNNSRNKSRIIKFVSFVIENIDTFLSIALAIVAAIVSTFSGKIELAIAATAGVLTILSIGVLRDRTAREQMIKEIQNIHFDVKQLAGNTSADDFFSRKSSEQDVIIQAESEIVLIQETGRLIAETNRREIVNFLKKGGRIRWISVLDDSPVPEFMAFRNANLITPQLMAGRMKNGTEMIEILATEAKADASQLEVRFFPYPIDITAVFKDPFHMDKRKREALIRLQGFRVAFDDKLDFIVNAHTSKETYELFYQQMESIWQASTKCLFLTGKPAIGKSTLLGRVVNILHQSTNLKIVGFITRDVRNAAGDRIAFETSTLDHKKIGQLATKKDDGTYELNHETMNSIIIPTLLEGLESADLLVIDEIGPIQLQNAEFQKTINLILEKRNLSIMGTVALQGSPYLSRIHQHYRTGLFEVTETNREQLEKKLSAEFLPRKAGLRRAGKWIF
jgi:nucleoside-triphosphatase